MHERWTGKLPIREAELMSIYCPAGQVVMFATEDPGIVLLAPCEALRNEVG
jgi:hypothetical protein